MGFWDNASTAYDLTDAQMAAESGGDPSAVSPKGARGLFQIMPATAKDYGVDDPSKLDDPKVNRQIRDQHLTKLLGRYNGDRRLALAAYNWGPAHIDEVGGDETKWPKETRDYVNKVVGPSEPASTSGGFWAKAQAQFGKALPKGVPTAEQEALQTPPESLVGQIEKHPYIAAAATGAAMGPTVPAVAAATEGAPLIGAGLGAAEQMAYTGIADLAARAAGPNHPYLGLAAGLIAPFVGGRVASGVLGGGAAATTAREAATEATEEVGTTAEEAAAKQETANVQEHAAAAKDVATEAEKTKASIAKAATNQGNANLGELADAHDLAQRKIAAFGEKLDDRAKALASGGDEATAARQAAIAEVAPQEAERQRAVLLGRSPEQTMAAQALPPAEAAARRQTFRQSVFGPIQVRSQELGSQFEEHYKPYRGREVDSDSLVEAAKDEAEYAKQSGAFSQPVAKLVNIAKKMSFDPAKGPTVTTGELGDLMAGEGEKVSQARFIELYDEWVEQHPSQRITQEEQRALAAEALGRDREKPPTVQEMLKLRRAANQAMASERDWPSRAAAWRIVKSIDQTLDAADVPKPAALNAEYKDFRDIFDHQFMRHASTTIEPGDVGGRIFEEPQRALNLFRYASPAEAQTLRENFADYVNGKGYSLADIGTKVNPEVRRAVFGDTALAGKEPWLKMEPKAIELGTLLSASPTARAQYTAAFSRRMNEIMQGQSKLIRNETMSLAHELGMDEVASAAFRAKTPQEVLTIAQKLASMTPQQYVQMVAERQRTAGQAAFEVSTVAKRAAREKFNQLARQQKQPGQAAQEAVADLPTSSQAGREALMNLGPSKSEEALRRFLRFRMLWYGGSIIGGSLMGHVPQYALGMAALDAAMSTFVAGRHIGRMMLRNPKIAELAWQAVKEPKGIGGLQVAGKASAEIIGQMAAEKARNAQQQQDQQAEEAAP